MVKMTIFHRNVFRILIIFTALYALLTLGACQHSDNNISRPSMGELPARLQPVFKNTRAICFSHFLIQVPDTAIIVYGPAEVESSIYLYRGESNMLRERLQERKDAIEKEKRFLLKRDIPNFPLFGKIIDGAIPGQKMIFGTTDRINYTIHSFLPLGADLLVQEFHAPPEEDKISEINELARKIRPRLNEDIPEEPGMCIENGFIPSKYQYERTTIGIRLKEFPDVHISIDAHKNLDYLPEGSNPILLREQAKQFAEADGLGAVFSRTKILRQEPRKIAHWNGVELALRTPRYKNDKSVHEFRFHSMGAVNDSLHPELDIRFDSGVKDNAKGRVEPSITDEEALALWDKLITTIRIRQPSDATLPKTPKVPLASEARTGDVCSQTGWWECEDAKTGDGNRRFLQKGDLMPHILLVDKTSFWNWLTRTRALRRVATVWKLVAYEDEPGSPSTPV
jgi:hypothetical protein